MCRIFTLLLYDYRQWRTDCEYYNVQPMVELHPRFIVHATCFDIATADDTLIVNITLFNPQLNCVPILWRFRHFYGTDVNMFAYAVTIIVNMTIYNLWLN